MQSRYHNWGLDGSDIPLAVGDRQYAQDKLRDFWNLREYSTQILEDLLYGYADNIVLNGCIASQGTGHTLSWSAGRVKAKVTIKTPTDWSSYPPSMSEITIPVAFNVALASNQAITGATTDGNTVNYAKLSYKETGTSSRTRARKAGSYNSEITQDYTFTCNSTAPTSLEIEFATFKTNGTTITFLNTERRYFPSLVNIISGTTTLSQTIGEILVKIDASGGSVTLNLPAALNNKAKFLIKCVDSTYTVTVNRAGSDNIFFVSNITSLNMGRGQSIFLISNQTDTWEGSNMSGITNKIQTFTTSDTWTCPAGVEVAFITLLGGGAGGGKTSGTNIYGGGGGGGAGQCIVRRPISVTPLDDYDITIGAGGISATDGGDSIFGSNLVIAKGGKKGADGSSGGGGKGGKGGEPSLDGGDGDTGANDGTEGNNCQPAAFGIGGASGGGAGQGHNSKKGGDSDSHIGGGIGNNASSYGGGGGGGASPFGDGADGGDGHVAGSNAGNNSGAGGGGAGGVSNGTNEGGIGGSGICIIEWMGFI